MITQKQPKRALEHPRASQGQLSLALGLVCHVHGGRALEQSRRAQEQSMRPQTHSRRAQKCSRKAKKHSRRAQEHSRRDQQHSRRAQEHSRRDQEDSLGAQQESPAAKQESSGAQQENPEAQQETLESSTSSPGGDLVDGLPPALHRPCDRRLLQRNGSHRDDLGIRRSKRAETRSKDASGGRIDERNTAALELLCVQRKSHNQVWSWAWRATTFSIHAFLGLRAPCGRFRLRI